MRQIPQLSAEEAARLVRSGAVMMVGGFGMTGSPVHLLHALAETETRDLTYIANNIGEPGLGGGRLLRNGQIKKAIGSYFTSNREVVQAALSGAIEYELLPQGSLAEAIRAGGAGIGGFYTPTAAGTALAENAETKRINGRQHVFVAGLRADVALIRARRADAAGNLAYRMTEQNFNKAMATAADLVIAEADEIVPVGALEPEHIHTTGNYVDVLVEAKTTLEELGTSADVRARPGTVDEQRLMIARRALAELRAGDVVNLGIGIPTLVADLIKPEDGIILHSENGMLGVGPAPEAGGALDYPVNAGKAPVTALPGSSYFDSADSFALIRGGHVDVAIMGGLQVDERGNLANWAIPGAPLLGVGGAMDLASGARHLIITMTHCNRDGSSKLPPRCSLPLTAVAAVDLLITELAVFAFDGAGMRLVELMPDATLDEVRAKTGASFRET
ncbi:MAG: 3-oxoacid CoA-transferase [Chloroflexi bacterium]|nr:3-oxoacid CoA-transferase [Chloroflexota bacterium]